jgi:DNA-binding CsgD family transcriptional regulator
MKALVDGTASWAFPAGTDRFLAAVAASRVPACVTDAAGGVVLANDAYRDLLGCGDAEPAPPSAAPANAQILRLTNVVAGRDVTLLLPDGWSATVELRQLLGVVGGTWAAGDRRDTSLDPSREPAGATQALTEREREVLVLIAIGASSESAAAELGVAGETVRTHVANAMAKLGAHTRAQAIALALRDDLIDW